MAKKATISIKCRRDQARKIQALTLENQALRQNERKFKAFAQQLDMALDAAKAGIWEIDVASQTVRVDDRVKALLGFDFPGNETTLAQWNALIATRATGSDYDRAIPLHSPHSHLDNVIRLAGVDRYVQYSSKPIVDEQGRVVKRVGMTRDVTERETLMRQLQSAKDTINVAMASSNAGYWEIPLTPNREGQYEIQVEDNFARLFHMGDARKMTTTQWSQYLSGLLYPPDAYDDFHAFLRNFDPSLERVVQDAWLRFPDGSETYIKNSAQLAYDQYGKPDKMIGMCVDFTQRIKGLEVANNLSETLLNSMRQMIYVAEIETDEVLFINDVMLDAFHITDDYHGKKYWELFAQSNMESVQAAKEKLDKNPDQAVTWEIYQPYLKKELSCVARYISWIDGHRVCFRTYFDISDIKKAERAVEEQLRQQRLMADIARRFIQVDDVDELIDTALREMGEFLDCYRVVIARLDRSTRCMHSGYEWYNPQMASGPRPPFSCPLDPKRLSYQKLLGESAPYCIVDDVGCFPHIAEDPLIKSILIAPYSVDEQFDGVLEFVSAQEGYAWSEGEIQLATMCASTLSAFFSRQRIAQRLVKARQDAESANSAKSAFLSNMSHEMRTPLNAIIGMTDLALKKAMSPEVTQCLDKIHDASDVLLSLVNNVLDMSKIEAAKLELTHQPFSLDQLLKKLYALVSVRALEKNQHIAFHVEEGVPGDYVGDAIRLTQVLTNVLYNAIKFSGEGTQIHLSVQRKSLASGQAALKFSVADQGMGMTKEQLERVFLPFEQGDLSAVRRHGGSGLGLSIAKQIVELMGGEMTAISEPGKGSTFTLTVQLDVAAPQRQESGSAFHGQSMDLSDKHILLVEDVEINREIVKAILEDTHVHIDEAENGLMGVEMFAAHPGKYQLVFMDIQMPELDGYAATRRIRALDGQVPIVAMTANAFQEDVNRSLRTGMNDHIIKPVDKRIILETVARYLLDAPHTRTSAATAPFPAVATPPRQRGWGPGG